MKNLIIILVLLTGFQSSGQFVANNKKANRYFELYKYTKAIPLYKKAVQSKDQAVSNEATVRLADCYRLTNNILEARSWYAKAVEIPDVDPINYYYLGVALQSLESYDEARNAFLRYNELMPGDEKGKILAGYCEKIGSLGYLSDSVIIKNAELLNSKFYDFCPVYYKNGLLLVSDRKDELFDERTYDWTNYGYLDLYFSEPSYYQDFWTQMSNPKAMSDVFNQTYHDGPVSFSADQKTVYVTRTLRSKSPRNKSNIRTGLLQIFSASLSDLKNVKYEPFAFNRQTHSSGHPALSKDGMKLIFSSDMLGGNGGSDLYLTEMIEGKWSQPVNVGNMINTFGNEVFPYWFNDTTLFFSSDGHIGYGGLDIYKSVWKNGSWGEPQNMLKNINSSYDDFGIIFREDMKAGFLSSNRPGGKGADDIYAIQNYSEKAIVRPGKDEELKSGYKPWVSKFIACGCVKDKNSLQPLDDAVVFILNSSNSEVIVLRTDSTGCFTVPVNKEVLYVAKALKPGYLGDCIHFRFEAPDSVSCNPTPRDLLLQTYQLNQVFTLENIYYDLDKWEIRPDALPVLDQLIGILGHNPINIELSSHTDSRANDEYNLDLSYKRAESAIRYIVMNGINPARLTARGFGETLPVNHCTNGVPCTEAEHQANRRTEFRVTSLNNGSDGEKTFDSSPFKSGDIVPVQMLGESFFKGCFEIDKNVISAALPPAIRNNPPAYFPENTPAAGKKPDVDAQATESAVETYFTVQVFAVTGAGIPDESQFKGETETFSKKIGGFTKYYVGKYNNYSNAQSVKKQLQNKFPGAFIVAFKDGNIVQVNELKDLLK